MITVQTVKKVKREVLEDISAVRRFHAFYDADERMYGSARRLALRVARRALAQWEIEMVAQVKSRTQDRLEPLERRT
jgi:hypothetical protein